ncbi:hypothetical protein DL95DRAFT_376664 [Leptodontidium sp. 2 PMI_412]|nr:hypothetical protein DL95DRAFT_376664 [Leptodontidium sp. 2 PMI_412]
MAILTEMSQRESIAMRTITVVTLIYLPATFVSTFFSTDVIYYQSDAPGSQTTFSRTALVRWFEVTIPLTVGTLMIAYCWYKIANRKRGTKLPSNGDLSMSLPLYDV